MVCDGKGNDLAIAASAGSHPDVPVKVWGRLKGQRSIEKAIELGVSKEFPDYVQDQLAPYGEVSARRMFGCVGLFHAGSMFGLIDGDDRFYLKADPVTRAQFIQPGCPQFTYTTTRKGQAVKAALSYFELPDGVLDASDRLEVWVGLAFGAARRGALSRRGEDLRAVAAHER